VAAIGKRQLLETLQGDGVCLIDLLELVLESRVQAAQRNEK
jgi:hypothetical protein